jgi:hypothetical protein
MAKFYNGRITSGKCGYSAYACDTDELPEYAVIGNPDCVLSSRNNYYRLARKIKGLVSDVDYFNLADVFALLSGVTEACDTSYDPNDDNGLLIDANGSFTSGLSIDNPIDPADDCFSTSIEYVPGAVDPVENVQSITLDNYPWANYWDFTTVPPILDSNTAPDVEMDCPFQVVESGGGYIVEGNPKNVIQIMRNGAIESTIVDSEDVDITGTGSIVYLQITMNGSEYVSEYIRANAPIEEAYLYQIATISSEIENLVCSTISIDVGRGDYDGYFKVTNSSTEEDPYKLTVSFGRAQINTDLFVFPEADIVLEEADIPTSPNNSDENNGDDAYVTFIYLEAEYNTTSLEIGQPTLEYTDSSGEFFEYEEYFFKHLLATVWWSIDPEGENPPSIQKIVQHSYGYIVGRIYGGC